MAWKKPLFEGVGVLNALPVTDSGAFNEREYERHLGFLFDSGVSFVQPGAAAGQVMTTSREEFKRSLELAVKAAGGKAKVTAYTGRGSTAETVALTQIAADVGADAAFVVPPTITKPDAPGLYAHYRTLADAVAPFPIVLYNNPERAGISLPLDVARRLLIDVPNVVALKNADNETYVKSWQLLGDVSPVYARNEGEALVALSMGAPGFLSISGNAIPGPLVELDRRWDTRDPAAALELYRALIPAIRAAATPPSPAGLHHVLALLGWSFGQPRMPILPVSRGGPEAERIAAGLEESNAALQALGLPTFATGGPPLPSRRAPGN